jgi:hypothetical protein
VTPRFALIATAAATVCMSERREKSMMMYPPISSGIFA